MDSNTLALKNYIDTQRGGGVSDEAIYNMLVSSGWQHDIVAQALSAQGLVVSNEPTYTQPLNATQPVATDEKLRKKVKIIGIITIFLGAAAVLSGLLLTDDKLLAGFGIVEVLIGIGVIQFSRVAYTLFNLLAILAILSSLLMLPSFAFAFLLIFSMPSLLLLTTVAIAMVLSIGQLGFYIYGGIVFHNKAIRLMFQSKRNS